MTCAALLVRHGADERLPPDAEGRSQHTIQNVYGEMLLQVATDYPGCPDPRTMTLTQIRFFYNGLRPGLRAHTKPKG